MLIMMMMMTMTKAEEELLKMTSRLVRRCYIIVAQPAFGPCLGHRRCPRRRSRQP